MPPRRAKHWGPAVAALALLGVALPCVARAQGGARVTVTAFFFAESGATDDDAARLLRVMRRDAGHLRHVRFVDASDALQSADAPSDEVETVRAQRDEIAQWLRSGDAPRAAAAIGPLVETFEANLSFVPRSELADAYMLVALVECVGGHARACRDGFRRVVTFRESLEYDVERYPLEFADDFEAVRERATHGPRGVAEVSSVPSGAEVFVDGRGYGATPAIVDGLLAGDHYVTLKLPGYERVVQRITVEAGDQPQSIEMELHRSRRARLLEDNLPRIRREVGGSTAGQYTIGLASYLFVNQVVLATLRREGDELQVRAYLYDLRTHFLLKRLRLRAQVPPGTDPTELGRIAQRLYAGVDLSGHIAAPEEHPPPPTGPPPLYGRWWFWTAIGVVATAGVVAGVVLSNQEPSVPDGWVRLDGSLQ